MSSYTIPAADGINTIENQVSNILTFHTFGIKGNAAVTVGKLNIQARIPGSPSTFLVPVGDYDFSKPAAITYAGPVADWVVTPSSVEDAEFLYLTITSIATGKPEASASPVDDDVVLREGIALGGLYVLELEVG